MKFCIHIAGPTGALTALLRETSVLQPFYAEQRASRVRDGREAILKRTRVVAQAPTSTLVSLRITPAAGTWNVRAAARKTSCPGILMDKAAVTIGIQDRAQ
eukprot:scaffold7516_cov81-Phaeocystis_antarctica.AAC.1